MGEKNQHIGLNNRRESRKEILLNQLELGTKPVKGRPGKRVYMDKKDTDRVKKEIEVLNHPILKYRKKNRKYDNKGEVIKTAD